MIMGIIVETALLVFLLYTPSVNTVFGGRPLNFFLLGVPGLGFGMLLLGW
jgi:sodium/potassium-transporting ATPase subunit alpha